MTIVFFLKIVKFGVSAPNQKKRLFLVGFFEFLNVLRPSIKTKNFLKPQKSAQL